MKGFFKTIWLTAVTLVIMTATSCSSEADYFGLDEVNETFNAERVTRASFIDCAEYLTISSYDISKWSDDDFNAYDAAVERIGVSFSKTNNKYIFEEPNAEQINISDSLYNCVISMYEHSNILVNKVLVPSSVAVKRLKSSGVESLSPSSSMSARDNDCVPAAISNMGVGAPTYQAVIAKCDSLFENWDKAGGVPTDNVKGLIEYYTPVTEETDLFFLDSDNAIFPRCVTLLGNSGCHTVNTVRIHKKNGKYVIDYQDVSKKSKGSGSISADFLYKIFLFN